MTCFSAEDVLRYSLCGGRFMIQPLQGLFYDTSFTEDLLFRCFVVQLYGGSF